MSASQGCSCPTLRGGASEFIKEPSELTMDCVSVIETAANKLNALMWRVDIKNRADSYNHQTNDPSLIRHLHDLAAMAELACNEAKG